jgi:hypothetical protein
MYSKAIKTTLLNSLSFLFRLTTEQGYTGWESLEGGGLYSLQVSPCVLGGRVGSLIPLSSMEGSSTHMLHVFFHVIYLHLVIP